MLEYLFMGIIIALAGGIHTYKKKQFPVKCILFENRANGLVPMITTAGRYIVKNKKYYYRIKYPNFPMGKIKKTAPFDYDSLLITNKGKNIIFIYSPEPDIYVPMDMIKEVKGEIDIDVPKLDKDGNQMLDKEGEIIYVTKKFPKITVKGLSADVREFIASEAEQSTMIYKVRKDFIDKFMPLILMIMFAVGIAIILYSASDMLVSGSSIMANAAASAAQIKGSIIGAQVAIPSWLNGMEYK